MVVGLGRERQPAAQWTVYQDPEGSGFSRTTAHSAPPWVSSLISSTRPACLPLLSPICTAVPPPASAPFMPAPPMGIEIMYTHINRRAVLPLLNWYLPFSPSSVPLTLFTGAAPASDPADHAWLKDDGGVRQAHRTDVIGEGHRHL